MQCYKVRNELSSKDQHNHVYVKDIDGKLIELNAEMIKDENGLVIIDLNKNGENK